MFPINGNPGTEMILVFESLLERYKKETRQIAAPTSTTGICCSFKYDTVEPIEKTIMGDYLLQIDLYLLMS